MLAQVSTPMKTLIAGGAFYGCGVYYMVNYYYKSSQIRNSFLHADPNFEGVISRKLFKN